MNAAALSELTVESAPQALWQEWLASYFDGAAHAVGTNPPVVFPQCELAFGFSPVAQPLNGSEIRVLCLPRSERAEVWTTGKLATDYVLFQFWVRAKVQGKGESEARATRVAELLKALLTNPDSRYALAEKGVGRLLPQAPQAVPGPDYALRLVACSAQLQYAIAYAEP